ncbi:hypothetical protein [Thalassotalea litorea]|uniref:hypothetical protein n=1 Tax=Thalassotalea litorea TaxID=2020715 RepID=UPI00373501AF
MGLFNWLFGSDDTTSTLHSSSSNTSTTAIVNCDGTPMIPDSMIDVEGKAYGQCSNDINTTSSIGIDTCTSSFDDSFSSSSIDDSFSSFDSSIGSSFSDDW